MNSVSVIVIGAGQAGLAVSHELTGAGIDHVLLERGRVAQRWASHSWESLRLLTPNWLSRLPGHRYTGPDPAGFMTAAQVAGYLRTYATGFAAPVVEDAPVRSVRAHGGGYRVVTESGAYCARAVVVATGWADRPHVPAVGRGLDRTVAQVTPDVYRNPAGLPAGGVLVVGASATGVQLADELASAGRAVVLATGSHTRMPRRYRGMDTMWWLDAMGLLERRLDQHPDPAAARAETSLQLVGGTGGRDVDLWSLHRRGVTLAGRLRAADGHRVAFAGDVAAITGRADDRLRRLLRRIDAYAETSGLTGEIDPPDPVHDVPATDAPAGLDLRRAGIGTVVWATGYRRAYPWLQVPVRDPAGDIRHTGGVTPAAGLYVLGMRWQSRRNSSFLDGVRHDAATVTAHIRCQVGAAARAGEAAR